MQVANSSHMRQNSGRSQRICKGVRYSLKMYALMMWSIEVEISWRWPPYFLNDNCTHFGCNFLVVLSSFFKVKDFTTTAYRPPRSRQAEYIIYYRTFNERQHRYTIQIQRDWDFVVRPGTYLHSSQVSPSTVNTTDILGQSRETPAQDCSISHLNRWEVLTT